MLGLLLAGWVSAGAPPNVDLNDLDHWEFAAEQFLDGPAGCWEIVGKATWNWDFGRFGLSKGTAVFASTLDDGIWGEFHVEPLGEVVRARRSRTEITRYDYEARWAPLFGKMDGEVEVANEPQSTDDLPIARFQRDPKALEREKREEERREARQEKRREKDGDATPDGPTNALRWGLDRVSGSKSVTSWTQWDDEKQDVVLFRAVPIEDSAGKEAEQTVRFPGGGLPDAMDVIFPESWFTSTVPRARVIDAKAHLRVRPSGGLLFPTASAFSADIGILGFRFSGAQTIAYKSIRPCAVEEAGPQLPDTQIEAPTIDEPIVEEQPVEEPAPDAEPTE